MWDFETDPEFQEKLDWADQFMTNEVEPLQYVIKHPLDLSDPVRQELIPPLQEEVRRQGLWACHLGPELGGPGYGQLKLALLNEILGRSGPGPTVGPIVFGTAAPDTGNAEILAHYGTPEQKDRYLRPLIDGSTFSAFSMTEPQGGSDPKVFTTTAVEDGDSWVINGEKWFSSNARWAEVLLVLAVTEPEAHISMRMSMFVVPVHTPGVEFIRHVQVAGWVEGDGGGDHSYIRYNNVRIPKDALLGDRGQGFGVAQTRLGGGRVHHAMRSVGHMKLALDMMCERALSRTTQGEQLAQKQLVQQMIAEAWMEIEQFRLLVLQTAWKIDRYNDYNKVRMDISAVKVVASKVLSEVATKALQIHGSLGLSEEMPFVSMLVNGLHVGLADGPSEIHTLGVAKQLLTQYKPTDGVFPSQHIPTLTEQARTKYASTLVKHGK
ncbi:acyl-CoA dehydrogenase family protein [Rhodococcus opacus]|uniref:Acyl-CoA dehydrogenase family protein n=1 Tax=Rhodococcus opacus TaxID=37919 RepID=A0AAX3YBV4_RHOOP|nr:acyl-CoA dehydrogenase family protein [Rhodococcus opacus]MCZ4587753.1 acyl-CoA dehydrogenase family protein [Rhodococcus opacus]WLF46902.1 acyl-CoA dehydrogenase family protein [Rhodococcus opacus]